MLTTNQIAKELSISARTVCRWLKDGRIPATKQGNTWWIREDAFNKFLDDCRYYPNK